MIILILYTLVLDSHYSADCVVNMLTTYITSAAQGRQIIIQPLTVTQRLLFFIEPCNSDKKAYLEYIAIPEKSSILSL